MNKRAMKRKLGFSRGKYYEMLREGNNQEKIIDEKGNEIIINPLKHILMNEMYKDDSKNKYLKDVLTSYKAFLDQAKKEEAEPTFEVVKEENV